jgi:hypothetical protein
MRRWFPHVERRALRGTQDTGDIAGLPGWVLELKNHREMELGVWSTEAEREARNNGGGRWAVIHKRRQHSTEDSYVTMNLTTFCELVEQWESA